MRANSGPENTIKKEIARVFIGRMQSFRNLAADFISAIWMAGHRPGRTIVECHIETSKVVTPIDTVRDVSSEFELKADHGS